MEPLLEGLNAAQKTAVTSPASVIQVLAPPGSGKTKTLTARVAYLINHEQLQPWNIIVCTFTIKAAREMRERIRGFVGEGIEKKLILGTFHSVARRFLLRYGQEIGIPKNFGIADTSECSAILKRIVQRQDYSVDPSQARGRISGLKAKGISAEQFAATQKRVDQHEFARVYAAYEEHLEAQGLLDYDDLLVRCVDLLRKHPACVSSIQAVLIDEYQDTNNIQYELMKLMAQRTQRITIVGDPDQSIYSFRSAEIGNLLRMRDDYPQSIVVNLENNYRSSGCILMSAMAVIEQDENRPNKVLVPTHCVGDQPTLRHLATGQLEAKWITEEIRRCKDLAVSLLNYQDYAILLRSASLSLSIERALGNAGIPYRMVGGKRFFDRAEIKVVLDYLRVINQPDYNDALIRVINLPSRKIGETTVRALLEEAEMKKITLWKLVLDCAQGRRKPECKISAPAQKGIETFVNLILTSRRKLLPEGGNECYLLDIISHVLQKISFEAYLKSTYKDNWKDRWANVEELVAQAIQMAASLANGEQDLEDALPLVKGVEQRPDTAADVLSKFLTNVALSTQVENTDGEQVNQVTISTIHAAKGLEWPVVFIPAVYDGSIPHSRAEDHDEERRLLYVGMTRAQALLYLSCPMKQSAQEDTCLSKFVSQSNIQKFFSCNGPTFGFPAIQSLSQILRRPCPLAAEVQAARAQHEYPEDDRYPLTREAIEGEEPTWNLSGPGTHNTAQSFKRRRLENLNSYTVSVDSVIMQASASFSTATTTLKHGNPGFTSARDMKALLEQAEAIRTLTATKELTSGSVKHKEFGKSNNTATQTKKVKSRAAGQGAITSFFTRTNSETTEDAGPSAILVTSLKRSSTSPPDGRTLKDISNMQEQTYTTAQPYKRPSFSNHRPRNAPVCSNRTETQISTEDTRSNLLPSSLTKPSGPPEKRDVSNDERDPENTVVHGSFLPSSGFRPASTFHATSMGQLPPRSGPLRKTLGARRTMQGWSVKHSQPPRPRSP